MSRWLFPLLFVLTLLTSLAKAQDNPIIAVNPGDGVPIKVGGYVYVDNWTPAPAAVTIKRADGTVVLELVVPPNGHVDIKLPNDKSLIGDKLTTTATNGTQSASATNPIVGPGMAEDDSLDGALSAPLAERVTLARLASALTVA